jgi:hypothetical protein
MADNSGAFAAIAEPDQRPRSTTKSVLRQNSTQQPKYLDAAILPRHRFANGLRSCETEKEIYLVANGGADSEAIISPDAIATKVIRCQTLSLLPYLCKT